jgi:hypothetical protein
MATLSFLDPPKAPHQKIEEASREAAPNQERFRRELPGFLWAIAILTALVIMAFAAFLLWTIHVGIFK